MSMPELPPPELTPSLPPGTTAEQRIQAWLETLYVSEQFLLAGLRRQIGPEGDLREAYRRWYVQHMEEHDGMMQHLAAELRRREAKHAP